MMPKVSLVITARNEQGYIGKCIESVLAQTYPLEKIEVVIIDGMSEDGTKDEVARYFGKGLNIRIVENIKKTTPAGMNVGVLNSSGDIVSVIVGHSVLDKHFVESGVECHNRFDADGIGGILNVVEDNSSWVAGTTRLAVMSIFGSGGKRYRSRNTEGYVKDTLPFCFYRRKTFEKFGMFDERLLRDQDEEYNYRILKKGGKIFFSPKIVSKHHVRTTLKNLWRQYFQYGYFKPLVLEKIGLGLMWKQQVPALFVAVILMAGLLSALSALFLELFISVVLLYFLVALFFSIRPAIKNGPFYLFSLPLTFFILHVSYGAGYLQGIIDFLIAGRFRRFSLDDLPLTR